MHVVPPGGPGTVGRWLDPSSSWDRPEGDRLPTFVRCIPRQRPPHRPAGIAGCDAETLARWTSSKFCFAPYQFKLCNMISGAGGPRLPSAEERELLLDFPARHSLVCRPTSARKAGPSALSQCRMSLLGNSFQCGVVAWLIGHWAVQEELLPYSTRSEIELSTRYSTRSDLGSS